MNFNILEGLTLTNITGLDRRSDQVIFETDTGRCFKMHHWQNCCEQVDIEDVCGDVDDLIGSPIVRAEERSQSGDTDWGIEEWTYYELATIKGSVTIRWYGESNGYYSTSVDFDESKPDYFQPSDDSVWND